MAGSGWDPSILQRMVMKLVLNEMSERIWGRRLSHWSDGDRGRPSNIVSSTYCDEDSNTAKLYHRLC